MIFERLKELRNGAGITQQNIADVLEVKRATYAGWETGKDIMPLRQLNKIANNYKVSLDYVTGLNNDNKKMKSKIGNVIDLNIVSENLKKYRKEKHLTQKDIASTLQTTQSNIHKYETGKCLITTVYALEFAKQFSCSLDELLGRK